MAFSKSFFRAAPRRLLRYVRLWPLALLFGFVVLMLCLSTVRSFRSSVLTPVMPTVGPGPAGTTGPVGTAGALGAASAALMTEGRRVFRRFPAGDAHEGWLVIRAWERMMDSLKNDSGGRRIYDSILLARPGILDSARIAEEFFYLHN